MRPILAAFALLAAPTAHAQQQQPLPTCEAREHRALDFWIGEWDAFRADTGALAGRSSIRSEDAGCVITEHWVSAGPQPFSGRSLNIYDRVSGRWEQFWVSSTGARSHFVGGPIENGVQMTAGPAPAAPGAPAQYARLTLTAEADGTVLQRGETSADGENWTLGYLFVYRRRAE